MANPTSRNPENKMTASDIGEELESKEAQARENIRDAREKVSRVASDVKDRASRMASNMSERMGPTYNDASEWVQDNYGKTFAFACLVIGAGAIGFLLGRRGSESLESRIRAREFGVQEVPGRDFQRNFEQGRGFERV